MKIEGKLALVTGGASGLGRAVVEMFLSRGAKVLILDLNQDAGQKLASEYEEAILFQNCDVSNPEQVESAIQNAQKLFGPLSFAINCAGLAFAAKTLSSKGPCDLNLFTKTIQVNLIGSYNIARLAAAAIAENEANEDGERGVIINTASVAAFDGQIGQSAYSASKGGIVGMTLPLARDLASYGIRVNTIAPGIFKTPMLEQLPQAAQDSLATQVPFPKRLGKPSEYAKLVQDIIENPMINAEVIRIDGAIRMGMK